MEWYEFLVEGVGTGVVIGVVILAFRLMEP